MCYEILWQFQARHNKQITKLCLQNYNKKFG